MTMCVKRQVLSCLVLATSIVAATGAIAQSEGPNSAAPIRVELRLDKTQFRAGDELSGDVMLRNVGDSAMFVDRRMYWGGQVFIAVLDEKRERVPLPLHYHVPVPPPDPADTTALVRLNSGNFFGMSIRAKVEDWLPRNGKYFLRATYLSALMNSDSLAPALRGLHIYWSDMPSIQSELVPVERVK